MGTSASTNAQPSFAVPGSNTSVGIASPQLVPSSIPQSATNPQYSQRQQFYGHESEAVAVDTGTATSGTSNEGRGGISTSSDGYKWRKYGQKTVKGSKFPRHYYKCTFPGCSVKKYVEQSDDGEEIISYKGGEHTHDPSRITRLNVNDQITFKHSVLTESLGQQEQLLATKSEAEANGEQFESPALTVTPRLVVETSADIDHLDDGYNWRKYGQKIVKGGPYPRNYYKCTEEDCPVKKQVEQHGNTIVTIYEGVHNHLVNFLEDGTNKKKRRRNVSRTLDKHHMDSGELKETKQDEGSEVVTGEIVPVTSLNENASKSTDSTEEVAIAALMEQSNGTSELL